MMASRSASESESHLAWLARTAITDWPMPPGIRVTFWKMSEVFQEIIGP